MKKTLLTASAFLVIGSSLSAQEFGFRKGSKIVEGSVSFGSGKEDGIKYSRLNLQTNLGYFLSEKVAIGSRALIVDYHQLIDEVPKVHAVTAGLFGRYYFLNLGKRFKAYTEVQSSYEHIQVTSLEGVVEVKEPLFQGVNFSAGLGANYFITPKVALSLSLGDVLYIHTGKEKDVEPSRETMLRLDVNSLYNEFSSTTFGLTFTF